MSSDTRTLRVAAVQMASENGEIRANLDRATGLAEEAAAQGARLVVFPEFMPTGYIFTSEIWDAGERRDGSTVQWLQETARRLGIWLGTSFLEAEGSEFFNTFVLAGPDGREAGSVRKQTPAAAEAYFCRGDKGGHVIETELGTIGVGICYENQLAFMPALMYSGSIDLMLMPHSAPSPTPAPWLPRGRLAAISDILRRLPTSYAQMLGVPVIYVNKTGRFLSPVPGMPFYRQDSSFPGESTIVDSDGTILLRLGAEEAVGVADVTLAEERKARAAPRRMGRFSIDIPWEINAFVASEAAGRLSYRFSDVRKKKASAISSPERGKAAAG